MPSYADHEGTKIAYDVLGDGPVDVLFIPSFVSHLDFAQSSPVIGRFLEILAEFSRLIVYDKAGTGLSDPVDQLPTLEDRVAEAETVLDTVGVQRAAIMGSSEGGASALLFAASRPARVSHAVLFGSFPIGYLDREKLLERLRATGHERFVPTDAQFAHARRFNETVMHRWGEGEALTMLVPSALESAVVRQWVGTFERCAASPGMARATWTAAMNVDVLDLLPSIRVPTLVVHFTDDPIPVQLSRLMADAIPGAELLEMAGRDHAPYLAEDPVELIGRIEEFLTGQRHDVASGRMVVSVLVSDIVASTARAADLGDARWRDVLDRHNQLVREALARHEGREVKTLGDGFLAIFPGPAAAIRCGHDVVTSLADIDVPVRIGIHSGEVEAMGNDIAGMAVHIAARVAEVAGPGDIVVSRTVKDLVLGSGIGFHALGRHRLKGLDDEWELFAIDTEPAPAAPEARLAAMETPGPSSTMKTRDRVAVTLSRLAPRASRALVELDPTVRELTRRFDDPGTQ